MYDSTTTQKAQDDLEHDPTLVPDGDEPQEVPGETILDETEFAGAILQREQLMQQMIALPKVKMFVDKHVSAIVNAAKEYYLNYHALPKQETLEAIVLESHRKCKDWLQYKIAVKTAFYVEPCIHSVQWWIDKLVKKARNAAYKKAFDDWIEAQQKNEEFDMPAAINKVAQEFTTDSYETYDAFEFLEHAEKQKTEWIADNWIAERALTLFAGYQKLGKSTLLHSLVGSIIRGATWYKRATLPTRVIYCDFENPEGYRLGVMLQTMSREMWKQHRSMFHVPKKPPKGITREWIVGQLKRLGWENERVLLMVDAARPAFQNLTTTPNWENTASEIRKMAQPLSELCHDPAYNLSIVLIHHENKGGDTSGSTDWEAVCDYVLRYKKHTERQRHLVAKAGRWIGEKPETLIFEKVDGRLCCAGEWTEVQQTEERQEKQDEAEALLKLVPVVPCGAEPNPANTVTRRQLEEQTDLTEKQVRLRVASLVQTGTIRETILKTGSQHEKRYFQPGLNSDGTWN